MNLVPDYILDGSARKKIDLYKLLTNKMKEVSSCQENIDTKAISGRKKKKAEFVAQPNGPFAGECAQLS